MAAKTRLQRLLYENSLPQDLQYVYKRHVSESLLTFVCVHQLFERPWDADIARAMGFALVRSSLTGIALSK